MLKVDTNWTITPTYQRRRLRVHALHRERPTASTAMHGPRVSGLQGLQNLFYNGIPELDFNNIQRLDADRLTRLTKSPPTTTPTR